MRSFLASFFSYCVVASHAQPAAGIYQMRMALNDSTTLPVTVVVARNKKALFEFRNADERILAEEITSKGDSTFVKMPVFDTELRIRTQGNEWKGVWLNRYRKDKNIIPISAVKKNQRFDHTAHDPGLITGKWKVAFMNENGITEYGVAIIEKFEANLLKATVLTETGDYRYLEGVYSQKELYLSCFDGSHAFYFKASLDKSRLKGWFYSGAHFSQAFTATRDPGFSLRHPDSITKPVNRNLDLERLTAGLGIDYGHLKDKPVLVQVLGTWCPNCLDETKYLVELYDKYSEKGLKILGLAFEKTTDKEVANQRIKRMCSRLGIRYPVVFAGTSDKTEASRLMKEVNEITAFPTLIFLNRKHEIVRIHTGFNGPATEAYNDFVTQSEYLVQSLLK